MFKINLRRFAIFWAFWVLSALGLSAEDSFADVSPALSAASGVSEEASPEDARLNVAAREAAALSEKVMEKATPGVDSAVVAAQQEVSDPFAMFPEVDVASVNPLEAGSVEPAGSPVEVKLEGIGFGSKDAYAIIGGEVFFKGDEKNGIKLVEVRRGEADIIVNGGPMTCPLFPGPDLQNAKDREKRKRAASVPSAGSKPEGLSSMPPREQAQS